MCLILKMRPHFILAILFIVSIECFSQNQIDSAETIICYFTQIGAQFPGGHNAMVKFLKRNLRYSKVAERNRIEGGVIIQFTVDEDSTLSDFEVAISLSKECDTEALRVAKKMPRWIPAIENGHRIRSRMKIPIFFKL